MKIPVYHFHDGFLKYTGIMNNLLPTKLKRIDNDEESIGPRFFKASTGWIKYKPLLIKPNNEEIKEIFDIKLKDEKDVLTTLKYLKKEGAQNILLTLGEKGMYFYDGNKMYYCSAPNINLVNSACAGDSALAAFLSEWLKGNDIEYALKKSSATGGNVAESRGIGTLDQVNNYVKKLEVREVN